MPDTSILEILVVNFGWGRKKSWGPWGKWGKWKKIGEHNTVTQ